MGGVSGNQLAVAQALDGAFNRGPGLNAVSGLFGLSSSQIAQALTVLSGSNASVGQSVEVAAGGQFAALMANRTLTRRSAADGGAGLLQGSRGRLRRALRLGRLGRGLRRGAMAQRRHQQGQPRRAAGDRRRRLRRRLPGRPPDACRVAVGLSDSNYSVPDTGANGRATGAHFGLYGMHELSTFYVNAAVAYSRFDGNATRPIAGIGTTETATSSVIANQLAERVEVGRAFDVTRRRHEFGVTPFVALQPVQLWTPGPETSVTSTGQPGVFALATSRRARRRCPVRRRAVRRRERAARAAAQRLGGGRLGARIPPRPQRVGGLHRAAGHPLHGRRRAGREQRRTIDFGVKYAVGSQTSLFANGGAELATAARASAGPPACA